MLMNLVPERITVMTIMTVKQTVSSGAELITEGAGTSNGPLFLIGCIEMQDKSLDPVFACCM